MLPHLKQFVKENETDLFIVAAVVLTALLSFGLGRLTAPASIEDPIIFRNMAPASAHEAVSEEEQTQEEAIVASKKGKKYHRVDCVWAAKIAPGNLIYFSSEQKAREAGYTPCKSCGNTP